MKKTDYTKRIEELKNQISDLETKAKKEKRAEDTRLKILLGAAVLRLGEQQLFNRCLTALADSDRIRAKEMLGERILPPAPPVAGGANPG